MRPVQADGADLNALLFRLLLQAGNPEEYRKGDAGKHLYRIVFGD
ncbi:MAG: hypothetical protein ACJAVZ_003557 [Afipia broomeae]|jgi:hypothetical protein|nr:hypothetical protein [Qipengyuania sp. HL-TH1]WPL57894.1 hypothetical protein SD421_05530 [Qipengyuania sp. HL-TH5]